MSLVGGYGFNEGETSLCVNGLALNWLEWANGWYEWDRPHGPRRIDEWAEPMFPVRPNLEPSLLLWFYSFLSSTF